MSDFFQKAEQAAENYGGQGNSNNDSNQQDSSNNQQQSSEPAQKSSGGGFLAGAEQAGEDGALNTGKHGRAGLKHTRANITQSSTPSLQRRVFRQVLTEPWMLLSTRRQTST